MARSSGFDRWLAGIAPERDDDGVEIDPAWRQWMRRMHETHGACSKEFLESQALAAIDGVLASAPWRRIEADFHSTTGRDLHLELGHANDGPWLWCDIAVDDRPQGRFSVPSSPDAEHLIVAIVDRAKEHSLDEEVWGGWPICPEHRTHPPRHDRSR